jgi:hypothetical protein
MFTINHEIVIVYLASNMKELFGDSDTGWNGGAVDLSYDSGEDLGRELSRKGSLLSSVYEAEGRERKVITHRHGPISVFLQTLFLCGIHAGSSFLDEFLVEHLVKVHRDDEGIKIEIEEGKMKKKKINEMMEEREEKTKKVKAESTLSHTDIETHRQAQGEVHDAMIGVVQNQSRPSIFHGPDNHNGHE